MGRSISFWSSIGFSTSSKRTPPAPSGRGAKHRKVSCLFITPLSCSLVGMTMEVSIKPGSRAAADYQAARSMEKFYCNFGLNPEYQEQLENGGLLVTGKDQNGEARIVELAKHPFFAGTLFVPQARSAAGNPHPLILEFCRAAIAIP